MDHIIELRKRVALLEKQLENALAWVTAKQRKEAVAREALREIYEVYAGSEGIPQPMTAAEGYLLSIFMEAVGIAQKALKEPE